VLRVHVTQRFFQAADGARVQLRDTRLVDPDLGADLLHGHFAVVVKADHFSLAPRQRLDGGADALTRFELFVRGVGCVGLRRHQRCRQRALVHVLPRRQRRGGFDGVNPENRPTQPLFVRSHLGGKFSVRRLVAELTAERFARRVELASLAADAARPGIAPEGVDHGAAHPALGKCFELDAAVFVEPVRGVDEPDDAVLDEVTDIDRIRHGRRHTAREGFDKRDPRDDPASLIGSNGMGAHSSLLGDSALVIRDLN
jgi:hypothetical protein